MSDTKPTGSLPTDEPPEILIKSKDRVKQHGEVFTPSWMVEKMLDELHEETTSIYKTILEPSAGNGNFLTAILSRKLKSIESTYAGEEYFWQDKALFALSSIYGIEIQQDNVREARQAVLSTLVTWFNFHQLQPKEDVYKSAKLIINANIIWGNTLTQQHLDGTPIIMSEWKQAKPRTAQVERIPFFFGHQLKKSNEQDQIIQGQLSLFDEPDTTFSMPVYKIVNIKKIHKEETV